MKDPPKEEEVVDIHLKEVQREFTKCKTTLTGHSNTVYCLIQLKDRNLASGSGDNAIKLWKDNQCLSTLTGHLSTVYSLIQLKDGNLASGSGDYTIKVWKDNQRLSTLTGHSNSVWCLIQ